MSSRLQELETWEREIIVELDRIARELEPLLGCREELKAKLELVQRLRGLEAKTAVKPARDAVTGVVTPTATTRVGGELQEAVREILLASGKPMHLRELRAALVKRGVPIPGKGTDANIIVHLRRASDMFDRRGRGIYALRESKGQRKIRVG